MPHAGGPEAIVPNRTATLRACRCRSLLNIVPLRMPYVNWPTTRHPALHELTVLRERRGPASSGSLLRVADPHESLVQYGYRRAHNRAHIVHTRALIAQDA